jgi:hypothetical protein
MYYNVNCRKSINNNMKLRKLNDIFEYQEKQLKKVRLKTDPKFDKLPYEGYVLSEQIPIPQPSIQSQPQTKPSKTSIKSKVGGFLQKVGKGYEALQRGGSQARALGRGDFSVLKDWGDKLKNINNYIEISKNSQGLHITHHNNNVIDITVKDPNKLTDRERAIFGDPNIAGFKGIRAMKSNGRPYDEERSDGVYIVHKSKLTPITK